MKFQFSIKSWLFVVAVIGIATAGLLASERILRPLGINRYWPWEWLAMAMPYWWPIVFVAFSVGRQRLTGTMVLLFAVGQIVSMYVQYVAVFRP